MKPYVCTPITDRKVTVGRNENEVQPRSRYAAFVKPNELRLSKAFAISQVCSTSTCIAACSFIQLREDGEHSLFSPVVCDCPPRHQSRKLARRSFVPAGHRANGDAPTEKD